MARIEAGFETLAAAVRMQGEQMLMAFAQQMAPAKGRGKR